MFHFLFKIVGLFVLALAVVLAVLDITKSITASEMILTSLASSWVAISEKSLESTHELVLTWSHPYVWDPVLLNLLKLPSWLIFFLVAMILLKFGQRRENPYGRFSGR
ncbi:MAG: hypothetical protein GKR97_09735 [Rhizobiaceae bacterium]|nr:hypothetical protein [Rhizobiaceae bacterium]